MVSGFRIIRRQVESLPDEALQQSRMVRQVIDDLGRRQPIPPHLQLVRVHVCLFQSLPPKNKDAAMIAPQQ